MLNNVQQILDAKGHDLLQPLSFGSNTGKTILEVSNEYWKDTALKFGYNISDFLLKVQEAKEYKESHENSERPVVTSMSQIRDWLYEKQQKQFIIKFGTSEYGGLIAAIGAGKTIAFLEMVRLRWIKGKDKVIVICPKSVVSSFDKAINGYFEGKATVSIVTGDKKSKLEALKQDSHFYITNPETVRQEDCLQALKEIGFTWIVCDEAHRYLISHDSSTVKYIMELSANIQMRFIMTGTPRRKSDLDFYQLVTFMDRGERFGTKYYKFRNQWFIKSFNGYDYFLNPQLVGKFKAIISELFHYVSKEDALKGVPPLIEKTIEVELTGEALKAYTEMHKESVIELKEYFDYLKFIKTIPKDQRTKEQNEQRQVMAVNAGVRILRLRQMSSGFVSWNDFEDNDEVRGIVNFNKDKINELSNVLDDFDEPVIIGAWFKQEIEDIEKLLTKKKLKFGTIKGGQSGKKTEQAKTYFADGKLDVIILQIKAGGTGTDGFQDVCKVMIMYSRDYAWYEYDQIKGRIERNGQKEHMTLINLVATLPKRKKTVDHAVMNSIDDKKAAFKDIVGDTSGKNKSDALKDIMKAVIQEV